MMYKIQIIKPTKSIIILPSIPEVQFIPAELEAIIVLKGFVVDIIVPIELPI